MKIAFIYTDQKIETGANFINDLIAKKLSAKGVAVNSFYPKAKLLDSPLHLKGFANILFFYSLIERKQEILKNNLIQGTTYTALPFLNSSRPVVCHFGSTAYGILNAVPLAKNLGRETKKVWYALKKQKAISQLNARTRRPIKDVAEIQSLVAKKASGVIATSKKVQKELEEMGVAKEKIKVIHNAIEDFWFENQDNDFCSDPHIVFLGRLGSGPFSLKIKGVDRLIHLSQKFSSIPKTIICMTRHKPLKEWLKNNLKNVNVYTNLQKSLIPNVLRPLKGSIVFLSSRYVGFSLSLIEAMSQGMVPVAYPVGVAPEIIKDNKNGFLVNNQKEAIEKVELLLKDKKLRQRLSVNAQKLSHQFKGEEMADELFTYYQKVINDFSSALQEELNSDDKKENGKANNES